MVFLGMMNLSKQNTSRSNKMARKKNVKTQEVISDTVDDLIAQYYIAEVEKKEAEKKFKAIQKKVLTFHKLTNLPMIENESAQIVFYLAGGTQTLDKQKILDYCGQEIYDSFFKPKSQSLTTRLTLKKDNSVSINEDTDQDEED